MFSHLLVPLDGSSFAEAALKAAAELADKYHSRLLLVTIANAPHAASTLADEAHDPLLGYIRHRIFEEATTYLGEKVAALQQQGYRVDSRLVEGSDTAEMILELARRNLVDTIVMSTHGRSGVSRWVFGSVAEKVLRGAEVPVLLLRPDAQATA